VSGAQPRLEHVQVGDVFDVQLGKMLSQAAKAGTNPRPYLGNRNVQWGRIDTAELEWMDFSEAERAKFELRPGDVLICEGGEVGRTAIWRGQVSECYYQKALHRLRPRDGRVLPEFMYHYMRHAAQRGVFDHWTTATSIAHLTKEKLEQVPLPLPPLDEQRRIADILDEADALRRKRREALQLLDELQRATFLEMFGDPVTNPKGWPVVPLASLVDAARPISYGILMPGPDQPGGMRYIRVVDMKMGTVDASTVRRTTSQIHNEYRRSILRSRDVIMSIRGHVGRVALVPAELDGANITQDTARLAVTGTEPEYVRDVLRMDGLQGWLKRHTKGVAVQGINLGDVKRIPIPSPPMILQREYAKVTSSLDALRHRSVQGATTTDTLFAALLDRAFRGDL
jgi:type I restriction enzyme S subunit